MIKSKAHQCLSQKRRAFTKYKVVKARLLCYNGIVSIYDI